MSSHLRPAGSLISHMSNLVKQNGGINLAQGIPGFAPPEELTSSLRQSVHCPVHQYAPGDGLPFLREFAAGLYPPNIAASKDFLITQGATEALSLVYTSLHRKLQGQVPVLSFDPAYESFRYLPEVFNNPYVSFPGIPKSEKDFEHLESVCTAHRIRVIFVASPGNPLGAVWEKESWERIVNLSEQLGIYLIADLVYKDLYYSEPSVLPDVMTQSHVILTGSFSKMLSITGWRLGYVGTSSGLFQEMRQVHDYTGLCAAHPLQYALSKYLQKDGSWRLYLEHIRERIAQNYEIVSSSLAGMGFRVSPAGGGYFVWAELPEGHYSGLEFALQLYDKTQTAVVPGIHFSETAERYIRLNLARAEEEISTGLERIRHFIQTHCVWER